MNIVKATEKYEAWLAEQVPINQSGRPRRKTRLYG